jgi:hypothetical protein
MPCDITTRDNLSMTPSGETDRDIFHLIVVSRDASKILLSSNEFGWSLPCVEVLPRKRVAHELSLELNARLGMEAYCLFVPNFPTPDRSARQANYAVLESIPHDDHAPSGSFWMPRTAFAGQIVLPVEEKDAIEESLRELDSYVSEPQTGPFGRPGWLEELFEWAQEQLSPLGLRTNGNFRQFNASPTFSLIRLETTGPAVWFKATGKPNVHELPITLSLTRLFPGYLPAILGVRSAWNSWLSDEVSNTTLDQFSELSIWESVAKDLAELQIASIGKSRALLEAQCRDLRLPKLIGLIAPFLARMGDFMAAQETQVPLPLAVRELDFLGERLQEAISILQGLGLPDTLGHTDLNPGNVLVSPARTVFLDWAEACVTSPFVTFEYLAEHLRRSNVADPKKCERAATAYRRPWESYLSRDDLRRAMAVSPLVAAFAYAVAGNAWCLPDSLSKAPHGGFLRSLTRRMHREATRLAERSARCSA